MVKPRKALQTRRKAPIFAKGEHQPGRQAGGHWFEPSTAHSARKSWPPLRHDDSRAFAWIPADAGKAGGCITARRDSRVPMRNAGKTRNRARVLLDHRAAPI